ncbi:hypothetical protein BVI434_980018 [Burkholderia vietnamiensis]|nr:hypothetical protein BVI2075_530126 [Burkholderia vietnamiensis]CAG9234891.1 hypothetical protein BVI434_980018 [Burkholderia vietnamiensis]
MPLTLETSPADTPLIAHLVTGAALHPDVVGRLAKGIFARSADQLAIAHPKRGRGPAAREYAPAEPQLGESRPGRRRRHPRHARPATA